MEQPHAKGSILGQGLEHSPHTTTPQEAHPLAGVVGSHKSWRGPQAAGAPAPCPIPGGAGVAAFSAAPPRPSHSFPFASAEDPAAALGKTRSKARAALGVLGPAAPHPQSGAGDEPHQGCLMPETPPGGGGAGGCRAASVGMGSAAHPAGVGGSPPSPRPAMTDSRLGAKVTKLYTGETHKRPLGPHAAPLGVGGAGQAGPAAPRHPPGKHEVMEPEQGWPVRLPSPRASIPRPGLSPPGRCRGWPLGHQLHYRGAEQCLLLPRDHVGPRSSTAFPGLSRPRGSPLSPGSPEVGGSGGSSSLQHADFIHAGR